MQQLNGADGACNDRVAPPGGGKGEGGGGEQRVAFQAKLPIGKIDTRGEGIID